MTMSLRGEINKVSGDIRRSINSIAQIGVTDMDGSPRGTKKVFGYVCKIHENGDLAGTVDVQEFDYLPDEYSTPGAGHHEGVYLSAIQDNASGLLVVPMLFSEVVVVMNPLDRREYVIMYSHAKRIKLAAHSLEGKDDAEIEIGVTETEDFNPTDDGLDKDYDELELTKHKAVTRYKAKSIEERVSSPDDEEGFQTKTTFDKKIIKVGDTEIVIRGDSITVKTSKAVEIKADEAKIETSNCEVKGSQVTITGGTLKVKGQSSTDLQGPFNAIKACPFSGAPHCGSTVSGT